MGRALIKILLGQKEQLFRGALAAVLSMQDDFDVVAESDHGDQVPLAAALSKPEVIVLEHALPSDLPVGELCRMLIPEHGVLVVTNRERCICEAVDLAKLAPRVGLIATGSSPEQLMDSIRRLADGHPVFDGALAVAALTAPINPLTEREREILRVAANGWPVREIAATLFLSPGTVRNYLSRIHFKTGARSRMEAIRVATESGWI